MSNLLDRLWTAFAAHGLPITGAITWQLRHHGEGSTGGEAC